MKPDEITSLIQHLKVVGKADEPSMVETQISWVILAGDFAYKIKKPVQLSFLDFSSLEKRKYYCERELTLNRRLAPQMYLCVVPIFKSGSFFSLDADNAEVVEYAVLMKRMDAAKEMDRLLNANQVSEVEITTLANKIATFHQKAVIVRTRPTLLALQEKFNDIKSVLPVVQQHFDNTFTAIVADAMSISNGYLRKFEFLIMNRYSGGFVRDVHGDMHTRNIFLYDDPVIFDCLEFSDDMRQIDILDELAFLCMDLDAFGRSDLSMKLYQEYLKLIGAEHNDPLFLYYKCYRANVRSKVYLLKMTDGTASDKASATIYLNLLGRYINELQAI